MSATNHKTPVKKELYSVLASRFGGNPDAERVKQLQGLFARYTKAGDATRTAACISDLEDHDAEDFLRRLRGRAE